MGIKKAENGVVGILDDGTVLVCSEEAERKLKKKGVKVIRIDKVVAL